jgi:ABC-type amino acid transport system permease subunit
MRETQRWAQFYFLSFEFYTVAGLIYLAIVLAVTAIWRRVERRLRAHVVEVAA